MRPCAILLSARVTTELDRLRAEGQSPRLDNAVAKALDLLQALPEMGAPVRWRGAWSTTVRRWPLDRTGYVLFCGLHADTSLLEVLLVWHEKRRPPRL